jgi:hypothetical protein
MRPNKGAGEYVSHDIRPTKKLYGGATPPASFRLSAGIIIFAKLNFSLELSYKSDYGGV